MRMSAGVKPSKAEAYALLRFFAPALPKRAKTAEQWVAKAAADKYEIRKALQYVKVEDGVAYASNGHRAHRCKTTLADGYYCPRTMMPVDIEERLIDIKRVFPYRDALEETAIESLEYGALPCKEKDARPLEYVRVPKSVAVARGYFEEAVNGAETGPVFYASAPAHAQKMVGDTEFGDWVIMAMGAD